MNKFDVNVIWVRLDKMREYLIQLKEIEDVSVDEYLENRFNQLVAERLIQVITEVALDINRHILSKLGILKTRQNWQNTKYFLEMGRQGILSQEVAAELAKAAGMRNILVHMYLEIDEVLVYRSIHESLKYYPLYIREISNYLNSLENDNS